MIDIDSFAVQNAYESNYEPPDGSVTLLLNVGCFVTNVNIVKDGVPYFTRDLSFAGNAILEAVQKDLGVDYDEANRILAHPGEERLDDVQSIVRLVGGRRSRSASRSRSYLGLPAKRTASTVSALRWRCVRAGPSRVHREAPGLAR